MSPQDPVPKGGHLRLCPPFGIVFSFDIFIETFVARARPDRSLCMVCYGRFTLLVAGHSVPIHPTSTKEVPEVLEE